MRLGTSDRRPIVSNALRGPGQFVRRDLGWMQAGQHHGVRESDIDGHRGTSVCGEAVFVWAPRYPAAGSAVDELRCESCLAVAAEEQPAAS